MTIYQSFGRIAGYPSPRVKSTDNADTPAFVPGYVARPHAGKAVGQHIAITIVRLSLEGTGWRLTELRPAGTADAGRRQALHIARTGRAKEETDVFARWEG